MIQASGSPATVRLRVEVKGRADLDLLQQVKLSMQHFLGLDLETKLFRKKNTVKVYLFPYRPIS